MPAHINGSRMIAMKTTLRFFVLAIATLLLMGLAFTFTPQFGTANASNATALPDKNAEYANGTLTKSYSLDVAYNWVNVSGTQVLSYAMYTPADSPYPGPIANLLGQHLTLADGTEVFVASALTKFEVYRDQNGDGIPQANFTAGDSEILYYMYTNMSDKFSYSPVEKTLQDSIPHYKWSLTYTNAYAYLGIPSSTSPIGWGGYAGRIIFDHITFEYDFSIAGNVSNLKTNFDIGKIVSSNSIDTATTQIQNSTFNLDNLGLALLFTTSTYASKPYTTTVNGASYNSSTAQTSATSLDLARVAVSNASAYDFVFGGNYTLTREDGNETHPATIETYEAKAEATALTSLPIKIYTPALSVVNWFSDYLNLTDMFGGDWPNVKLDYNASSLIYRVCFPVWDGQQIIHDPVYVGYISSAAIPEFPAVILMVVVFTTVSSAVFWARKRRSTAQS